MWYKKIARQTKKIDSTNSVDDLRILPLLDTVRYPFDFKDSRGLATTPSLKRNCNSFCKVRNGDKSYSIHIFQQRCKYIINNYRIRNMFLLHYLVLLTYLFKLIWLIINYFFSDNPCEQNTYKRKRTIERKIAKLVGKRRLTMKANDAIRLIAPKKC